MFCVNHFLISLFILKILLLVISDLTETLIIYETFSVLSNVFISALVENPKFNNGDISPSTSLKDIPALK